MSTTQLQQLDLFAGGPHVASDAIVSIKGGWTFQPCALCGAPLVQVVTGSGAILPAFATGALVGFGCRGASPRARKRDDDDGDV